MDRESQNSTVVGSPPQIASRPLHSRVCFLLGALFLVLVSYPFFKHGLVETWNYTGFDWGIYYQAAQDLRSGISPYPPEVLDRSDSEGRASAWNKYMYPPFFARLLVPLTWLSELWAKRVFQTVCCVCYLCVLLPRRNKGTPNPGNRIGNWLAIALVFGWGPSIETIRVGQANLLPLISIAVAYRLLSSAPSSNEAFVCSGRDLIAGLCLGGASAVKLTPLVILPLLLVTLHFRIAIGMVIGFACALVLPGPWTCWQYLTRVVPTFSGFPEHQESYTFSSWLARCEPVSTFAFPIAALLFTSLVALLFFRRKHLRTSDLIALGCWLPAIFGGVWFHHYALAALPIAVGVQLLALNGWKKTEADRVGFRSFILNPPFLRLAVFVILLLPGLTYWQPVGFVVGKIVSLEFFSFLSLFVAGNVAAFLIFLYELTREKDVRG